MSETVNDLLMDLLSRDTHRVWSAACAVNVLRDPPALTTLAEHLPEIERATEDLGGGLFPNNERLRQAIYTLRAQRDGLCRCWLYPEFLTYAPLKEQEAGDVTVLSSDPPDWHMDYHCRCAHCGTEYKVEQREGHLTWWKWLKLGDGAS
ncbi:hypothetical protein [Deinococcus planocerae]|uniref:hypothetical protein n=1 Tax=Deinococcus planocerae TaxID=1737569 RepID=UPI000C7F4CE8|nr:hypothetical protein [Deinococcus planocerae]